MEYFSDYFVDVDRFKSHRYPIILKWCEKTLPSDVWEVTKKETSMSILDMTGIKLLHHRFKFSSLEAYTLYKLTWE